MRVLRIDHVQLGIPAGGEDKARAFFSGLLGIPEAPKPAPLAARGGAWFELGELKIHVGVEQEFRAAKKAHPALQVDDLAALVSRLRAAGVEVADGEAVAGYRSRVFVDDPFGNRIELVELAI
jgi:catechol 2,3-dioxygenase-like lactoylglutathione lyase family enzyme